MKIVTLSSKNQITIPNDLLISLGARSVNKFLLEENKGVITMRPLKNSIVDEVAGSLTKYVSPDKLGVPFEKIMEETKRITAEKLAKKK